MRMHQLLPWPVAAYVPPQKKEKAREPKEAEKPSKALEAQLRVPPPPQDEDFDENFEDGEKPGGKTDILA